MKSLASLLKGQRGFDYTGGTDIGWAQRIHHQSTRNEPYNQKRDVYFESDGL